MRPASTPLQGFANFNANGHELGSESGSIAKSQESSQNKLTNSRVIVTIADDSESETGSVHHATRMAGSPTPVAIPKRLIVVSGNNSSRDVMDGRESDQDDDVSFISESKVAQSSKSTTSGQGFRGLSASPESEGTRGTGSRGVGATAKPPTHKRRVSQTNSPETAKARTVRRRKQKPVPSPAILLNGKSRLSSQSTKKKSFRRESSTTSPEHVSYPHERPHSPAKDTDSPIVVHRVDGVPHQRNMPKIPLEPQHFEQLVITAEKELRESQEYMVLAILNQERTACRHASGTELKRQSDSPFTALKVQTTGKQTCRLIVKDPPVGGASNKVGSSRSINTVISDVMSEVRSLPRYKSIGRLGQTPLARNVTIGKYTPYFPEDEMLPEALRESKYQELRDRYKAFEDFHSGIQAQRNCVERRAMWRPFIVDLMKQLNIDHMAIVSFFKAGQSLEDYPLGIGDSSLAMCLEAQTSACLKCGLDSKSRWEFEELWERAKSAYDIKYRSLPVVGLLSAALLKITGLLLWHVIYEDDSLRESLLHLSQEKYQRITWFRGLSAWKDQPIEPADEIPFCLVCGLAHCPSHGHFLEEEQEEEESDKKMVLLNDPEDTQNIHGIVNQPMVVFDGQQKHVCGVYCVEDADKDGIDLRGLRENGKITGRFRTEMERSRSPFDPKETCSPECFWDVRQRSSGYRSIASSRPKLDLWPDQLLAFEKCLEMCLGNERGPCMMRGFLPGVRCRDIFHMMLQEMRAVKHEGPVRPQPEMVARNSHGQRKWKGKRKGREETTKLEDRPVFVPCNHAGSCQDNPRCSCFRAKIECEWMCGCDVGCERRFPGCSCHTGSQQVCIEGSCECWMRSRECDPWLCGSCGVVEVLDQANKYKEEIRKHRCMNNRIQLGLPARTIKAPSEVQGFGLFAGEDIPRNGFIGEYKGEVTSREECNRRGSAYHLSGMEYLFNLNQDQEVDASNFGNKTRFMNNSSNEQNINVVGSTMLCNGVQRVMLCAKRDIKAGEELLFDYKYPEHVRENFWERGEGDASKNAMALAPGGQRSTSKSETEQVKNGKGKARARKPGSDQESDASGSGSGSGIGYVQRPQTSRRRKHSNGSEASSDSEFEPMAKPVTKPVPRWHRSEDDEPEWQGSGRDSIAESVSDR